MFEVLIYKEGMDLPKTGNYFVVAGNGLFMHQDLNVTKAFVKVPNISCLDDLHVEQSITLDVKKIPADLVWTIKKFFQLVFAKHHAESEVNLYYNPNLQTYKVHVPNQVVSYSHVGYQRIGVLHIQEMEGYLRVGTIHSHCDFNAFHSSTDIGDEIDTNGLHVTFGYNDQDNFTITSTVVVNGYRKEVSPLDYLEGITQNGNFFQLIPHSDGEQTRMLGEASKWLEKVNPSTLNDDVLLGESKNANN